MQHSRSADRVSGHRGVLGDLGNRRGHRIALPLMPVADIALASGCQSLPSFHKRPNQDRSQRSGLRRAHLASDYFGGPSTKTGGISLVHMALQQTLVESHGSIQRSNECTERSGVCTQLRRLDAGLVPA
jgi:hypothetical protein